MIEKLNKLTVFEKLSIYMDYFITQSALKNNFHVEFGDLKNSYGWSEPDKKRHETNLFFLWRGIKIESFENFISEKNIRVTDNGENWKEAGFAQRIRTDYFGIFGWYERHIK